MFRLGGRSGRSLARRLLVLQVGIVTLTVALCATVTVFSVRDRTRDQERARALAVAETLAQSPDVATALARPDPSRTLQPLAERIRRRTGVAFVVVMSRQGIRYSHPNPARIGQRFVGHIAPAQHGHPFTETYRGTLGVSVRAVVPVERGTRVIGLVAAGVLQETISEQLTDRLPELLGLAALALAVGVLLSVLVARRVKRQTLGLEPHEITKLYEHHHAVLHAIREGVLVVGRNRRIVLANDEARRLLGLADSVDGEPLARALPPGSLRELLASGEVTRDSVHLVGDRVLVANQSEAVVDGRPVGTVTTLRDRTELQGLTRELDTVRGLADSLRAQAHESANQLHTLVGLVELGRYDEAVEFATERVERAQELLERLQERVDEPALVALLLGKTATAAERGIDLEISDDTTFSGCGVPARELVTIVGNLIDNAMDAAGSGGHVAVGLRCANGEMTVEVRDDGPGITPGDLERVFEPGWTTKRASGSHGHGLGLALVRQAAERLGGRASARNDGGAVFTVRIPVAPGADPPASHAPVHEVGRP